MKLLSYKQDRRSLLFILLCLLFLYIPFSINISIIYAPLWLMVSSFFCFSVCIVNHNHVHNAMFRYQWMNIILGVVLTICRGHTSVGVILAHNHNHHVYTGNDKDWIKPGLAGEGTGITRLLRFVFAAIVSMARGRRHANPSIIHTRLIRQKRLEQTTLLLLSAVLLYLDIVGFLIFVVLPWIVGVALLIGVNLLQHDNCIPNSKFNHSRNFTSRIGNWLCLNNGYHTVHHMRPELHWSRLPEVHQREVEPYMDSRLNQSSIIRYLTMNYLTTRCILQGEKK